MPRKLDESRRLQKRAEKLIPGGVYSPVRAFKAVECDAPFIVRGQGSQIWDADGNEYIDYVGSWGPLILGPRCTRGDRGNSQRGRRRHQLRRIHTDRSSSSPSWWLRGISARGEDSLRQLRHRSHHVGHPAGARLYQARVPSSNSKAAITATRTRCWSRPDPAWLHWEFRARPAFPRQLANTRSRLPLQRYRRPWSRRSASIGTDRMRHRRARGRKYGLRSAGAGISRQPCAKSRNAQRRAVDFR